MTESNPTRALDVARLFAEERESIHHQLARMVPATEVDDLLQEVFVKVVRAWPEFRGEASVATWLHRIARRAAIDYLRSRHHREARQTDSIEPSRAGEAPDNLTPAGLIEPAVGATRLVQQEMRGCIREHVERLLPAYRQVIELKDLAGLTNIEIASRLGLSLDLAKIRLHRARVALRKSLETGCELYQGDTGDLACERRPVSLPPAISSKGVPPKADARCAASEGFNSIVPKSMSSASDCGCAATENCAPSTAPSDSLMTAQVAEFVALGAAIGANCEPCLRFHVREAEKLGISSADIAQAIALAAHVKETPARNILKLGKRLTQSGGETAANADQGGCGCPTK